MFAGEVCVPTSCNAGFLSSVLPTLRTYAQVLRRFGVKALSFMGIPERISNNAPDNARPEVIGIVKAIDRRHHFLARQSLIFDMRKLMAAAVRDGLGSHLAVELVVKFGAEIGMRNRNLDGFRIDLLGEINGAL